MVKEILSAFLAAAGAVGLVLGFASCDEELPRPNPWMLPLIAIASGAFCFRLNYNHGEWCWYTSVFVAYLSFSIYTDAVIHKIYVIPNYFILGGVLLMTILLSVQKGDWNPIPFIVGGVFLAMGFSGAFGRGDGFALAIMMLYEGILWDNNLMIMLVTILGGCGVFVVYSAVDYLLKKYRNKQNAKFWKQANPLIPSMGIGLALCTWFVA